MAQPPDISETFLREVDENLRRDQMRDFGKQYGAWLIAAVVLFLAACGGWIWWQHHQVKRSEQQVEQLGRVHPLGEEGQPGDPAAFLLGQLG